MSWSLQYLTLEKCLSSSDNFGNHCSIPLRTDIQRKSGVLLYWTGNGGIRFSEDNTVQWGIQIIHTACSLYIYMNGNLLGNLLEYFQRHSYVMELLTTLVYILQSCDHEIPVGRNTTRQAISQQAQLKQLGLLANNPCNDTFIRRVELYKYVRKLCHHHIVRPAAKPGFTT